jgi:hypothetical protein
MALMFRRWLNNLSFLMRKAIESVPIGALEEREESSPGKRCAARGCSLASLRPSGGLMMPHALRVEAHFAERKKQVL